MADVNDVSYMTGLGLDSNINTASSDKLFYYHRSLENISNSTPIIVLIHGYPQTNFMWRHLIPILPQTIPLFIPDIPGYGRSPPLSTPHNKTNQAAAILRTLSSLILSASLTKPQPVILVGHDRGARICHRIAVTPPSPSLNILGSILLDIVPTLIQWQSFSTPSNSIGSFHWPFLANVSFALPLIMSQGGDVFMRGCIERWVGKSPAARAKFEEHDAIAVYAESFKREEVVRATCDDYRAGGQEDIEEQLTDQAAGRKIDGDVLILYSSEYLEMRYDLKKAWEEWVSGKGTLECVGIGDEVGHFIAEEAPEQTAEAILGFYRKFV